MEARMQKCKWVIPVIAILLSVAFVIPVIAADPKTDGQKSGAQKLNDTDKDFVKKAVSGGKMEVELGQMAKTKAKSQEVKDFGAMMVKEHGKANDELKTILNKKNMKVPRKLEVKHTAVKTMLKPLSGENFDKQYMEHMVSDHMKDVTEFREAQQSLSDQDIKGWVEKTLPVLEKHLEKAREVAGKVGVDPEKIKSDKKTEK
jgi:putative membrane protein